MRKSLSIRRGSTPRVTAFELPLMLDPGGDPAHERLFVARHLA